jgi:hypothetical protein
VINPCA